MSKEKLGQQPAFMNLHFNDHNRYEYNGGMSKRFFAACIAMQGILIAPNFKVNGEDVELTQIEVAKYAYLLADELLKQENE